MDDYRLENETRGRPDVITDLGITFDTKLSFTLRFAYICDSFKSE